MSLKFWARTRGEVLHCRDFRDLKDKREVFQGQVDRYPLCGVVEVVQRGQSTISMKPHVHWTGPALRLLLLMKRFSSPLYCGIRAISNDNLLTKSPFWDRAPRETMSKAVSVSARLWWETVDREEWNFPVGDKERNNSHSVAAALMNQSPSCCLVALDALALKSCRSKMEK